MNPAGTLLPEQALAEGFADHVVRWARERNAPPRSLAVLRAAARATSLATASGHVCTPLAELAAAADGGDVASLRRALVDSHMVGTPAAVDAAPLVLDDDDRLYLHRYYDFERRLAERLLLARAQAREAIGGAASTWLGRLYATNAKRLAARPDWQKIATALALLERLTIISGGPGTGKTTTVVSLLACALAQDPDCRIRLAAPTGRAAARMLEAVRTASARLPAEIGARMPDEAFTVHRLLGVRSDSVEFRHNADNPLAIDLLVVDEASMLDLALATRLVEAVPSPARIVLLGDKDQLAAVESGAVFAELSADPTLTPACIARLASVTATPAARIAEAAPRRPSWVPRGLVDSVVWLSENFRFGADSGIGQLALRVNAGDAGAALEVLRSGAYRELAWRDDASFAGDDESLAAIVEGMRTYVDRARSDLGDRRALFDALGRFRVLCAQREGARGVVAQNRLMSEHFARSLDLQRDRGLRDEWFPGSPIMVLRNDPLLKLYNGDVGIVLPDEDDRLAAYFPDHAGGFRAISLSRLPEHEAAFATTVHKAQGSEFDRVLLMLPAVASRVVTRELLYTAITRARQGVTIVASADVLEKAIATPTRRYSGLAARIARAN